MACNQSFLKGEIIHSEITTYNFNELRHIWESYLELDVLCLAVIHARHAIEMQKMSKIVIKESLTEASFGWNCFELYNKYREFNILKRNMHVILYANPLKVEGSVLLVDVSSQNNLTKY